MVTADVFGLYRSIPHDAGLEAFRKALDNQGNKKISTHDLTKMTKFLSENKYIEFNRKVKKGLLLPPNLFLHTHVYL